MPPVEDHPVHPSVQRDRPEAGCFNREAFDPFYYVQDGWTVDGRRHMIKVRHRLSTLCRQTLALPECEGCQVPKDVKYIKKMKAIK